MTIQLAGAKAGGGGRWVGPPRVGGDRANPPPRRGGEGLGGQGAPPIKKGWKVAQA